MSSKALPADRINNELARVLPELGGRELDLLTRYLLLVEQYSPALNLTAFRGAAELAFELGVESLRLIELGPIPDDWSCADLGSGVGSPVVPLSIACPQVEFSAIESRQRRATFLRQVQAQLGLGNLRVLETRTEQVMAGQPASFDLVTARAYGAPKLVLAHARALLAPGGELRGYLGADASELETAALAQGFAVEELRQYSVDESLRHVYRLSLTAI